MNSILKHRILPAFIAIFTLAGAAQAERLICEFPENNSARGWVKPVVVFDVDASGQVIVADDVVMHFADGPMATTVRTNNARRLTVTWDVDTQDSLGQRSRLRFSAFIKRPSLEARIQMTPRGYRSLPGVDGQCRQGS